MISWFLASYFFCPHFSFLSHIRKWTKFSKIPYTSKIRYPNFYTHLWQIHDKGMLPGTVRDMREKRPELPFNELMDYETIKNRGTNSSDSRQKGAVALREVVMWNCELWRQGLALWRGGFCSCFNVANMEHQSWQALYLSTHTQKKPHTQKNHTTVTKTNRVLLSQCLKVGWQEVDIWRSRRNSQQRDLWSKNRKAEHHKANRNESIAAFAEEWWWYSGVAWEKVER